MVKAQTSGESEGEVIEIDFANVASPIRQQHIKQMDTGIRRRKNV